MTLLTFEFQNQQVCVWKNFSKIPWSYYCEPTQKWGRPDDVFFSPTKQKLENGYGIFPFDFVPGSQNDFLKRKTLKKYFNFKPFLQR